MFEVLSTEMIEDIRANFRVQSRAGQVDYVCRLAGMCGAVCAVDRPTVWEFFHARGERYCFNSACYYMALMVHRSKELMSA